MYYIVHNMARIRPRVRARRTLAVVCRITGSNSQVYTHDRIYQE